MKQSNVAGVLAVAAVAAACDRGPGPPAGAQGGGTIEAEVKYGGAARRQKSR